MTAQKEILERVQENKVKDYKKSVAENQDADDSCFDNAFTSHDLETISEVVQNIEKANKQFKEDLSMAADS